MNRVWIRAVLMLTLASGALAGDLAAKDAWVRQPPPGANAAAYLTIENGGDAAQRVVGVHCPAAEKAELHETRVVDGMAKMGRVEGVDVPAGGSVTLAPRGLHIMLFRPKLPAVGETLALELELEGGAKLPVAAEVRGPHHEAEGGHVHH